MLSVCTLIASMLLSGMADDGQTVDFSRRPVLDESRTYVLIWSLPASGKLNETLKSTILSVDPATKKVGIRLQDVGHIAEGADPGPKPQDVESSLNPHNLPTGLTMKGNNYIWIVWAAAGYTPDAKVAKGAKYAIEWKTANDDITLKGNGEVVSIDSTKNTVLQHIVLEMDLKGRRLNDLDLTSVSDLKSGAMLSSQGTFGFPGFRYKVKIESQP